MTSKFLPICIFPNADQLLVFRLNGGGLVNADSISYQNWQPVTDRLPVTYILVQPTSESLFNDLSVGCALRETAGIQRPLDSNTSLSFALNNISQGVSIRVFVCQRQTTVCPQEAEKIGSLRGRDRPVLGTATEFTGKTFAIRVGNKPTISFDGI
ncbi:hypothetical protein EG329_009628 [Mollisiaceae sp. DMI_Dod_QoI]|nr:hypothetical protein EG329_009628 [Helotiales sp. DMI_Dod_QoI]